MKKGFVFLMFLSLAGCLMSGCVGEHDINDEATIIDIIDGDTYDVLLEGGSVVRVRLIGIDTPEIFSDNDESLWSGISMDVLKHWGMEAKEYAEENYLGRPVTLIEDEFCDEKDKYDRYLYYLEIEGLNINKDLVERGLARAYGKYTCQMEGELAACEEHAKEECMGVWSRTYMTDKEGIYIAFINYDAVGNDNDNLNDEYVIIMNGSSMYIELDGWILSDNAGKSLVLDGGLEPGCQVKIFSGCGESNGIYWCSDWAIWNNDGDAAYLRDENGVVIDTYQYAVS
ncbi:MAG TPA: thermonuclease family protein [Candidatus Methanofastidiosa archaeon]|nr:thermonuclease family protein [Candidatus Methanofastidiosa archaeon]HPR42584.1 thermonuclease family protein [Candidatus Methanofastidiosa archaeon]